MAANSDDATPPLEVEWSDDEKTDVDRAHGSQEVVFSSFRVLALRNT